MIGCFAKRLSVICLLAGLSLGWYHLIEVGNAQGDEEDNCCKKETKESPGLIEGCIDNQKQHPNADSKDHTHYPRLQFGLEESAPR